MISITIYVQGSIVCRGEFYNNAIARLEIVWPLLPNQMGPPKSSLALNVIAIAISISFFFAAQVMGRERKTNWNITQINGADKIFANWEIFCPFILLTGSNNHANSKTTNPNVHESFV